MNVTRRLLRRGRAPGDDRAGVVEAAVLGPRGRSDAGLRRAIVARAAWMAGRNTPPPAARDIPDSLLPLVDQVVRHAYRITDEDLEAAVATGHDENELFDVIVAAAVGAGMARRERGLDAISAWERAR